MASRPRRGCQQAGWRARPAQDLLMDGSDQMCPVLCDRSGLSLLEVPHCVQSSVFAYNLPSYPNANSQELSAGNNGRRRTRRGAVITKEPICESDTHSSTSQAPPNPGFCLPAAAVTRSYMYRWLEVHALPLAYSGERHWISRLLRAPASIRAGYQAFDFEANHNSSSLDP